MDSNDEDEQPDTPERVRAKLNRTTFTHELDAFDDFLGLMTITDPVKPCNTESQKGPQVARWTAENDDEESSFMSDYSEDEMALEDCRLAPLRGVRKNHSGDLERIFQKQIGTGADHKIECSSSRQDRSNSPPSACNTSTTSLGQDSSSGHEVNSPRVNGIRSRATNSNDSLIHDQSVNENVSSRTDGRLCPDEPSKINNDICGPRRRRRSNQPNNMQLESKEYVKEPTTLHSSSSLNGLVHCAQSIEHQRNRRGEMSFSEHSRPRIRRDTLYGTKKLTSTSTIELSRNRPHTSSELDFQRAAAAAAKKRQAAGGDSYRRTPHRESFSPVQNPPFTSSLRRSSGFRNSSAELQTSSRLRRTNNSPTSLSRFPGSIKSVNNLSLSGVYSKGVSSSPRRCNEDTRRIVKKNDTTNIDDLVFNLGRKTRTGSLQRQQGNATWNISLDALG